MTKPISQMFLSFRHDLNTKYGNRDDLRHLIGELKGSGITPMLDLVINHRCGVRQDDEGQWTIFEDPDWGSWAIVYVPFIP